MACASKSRGGARRDGEEGLLLAEIDAEASAEKRGVAAADVAAAAEDCNVGGNSNVTR